MRRMYSEQELTNVIKAVFEQELADGALDENVSDAVDAYLVENPVDITALEGQTINPARIDVANINGETSPSVKPIYYHPIYMFIRDGNNDNVLIGTLTILDNQSTAYTKTTLATKLKALLDLGAYINFNGGVRADGTDTYKNCIMMLKSGDNYKMMYLTSTSEQSMNIDLDNITFVNDGVNKIN